MRYPETATPLRDSREILSFLTQFNPTVKQSTKRLRYIYLKGFFNFCTNTLDEPLSNPCNTPTLRKMFRDKKKVPWTILEKEVVDEIIFKARNIRDRLMMELMARGGMRVNEVLKLTPRDIEDRKLLLRDPKSGKEVEPVYIPQKIADRLKEYIRTKHIESGQRIFPITYSGARLMVKKAGKVVGINLKTHDLRRVRATSSSNRIRSRGCAGVIVSTGRGDSP